MNAEAPKGNHPVEIVLAFLSTGLSLSLSEVRVFDAWLSLGLKVVGLASGGLTVWLLVLRIRHFGKRGGKDSEG